MKVLFLTPSVSRQLGGIFEIERRLAQTLAARPGVEVEVFGLEDEDTAADLATWQPLRPRTFAVRGPRAFGYAPGLLDAMLQSDADLVHLHALWMYTSVATLLWTRRTGRPHVVTINGMLDAWAVQNARWKKRLAGWLYEDAMLREAACLQVNTPAEHDAVRAYGIGGTPTCTVPNGVDLPGVDLPGDADASDEAPWRGEIGSEANVLLFLGRIHPKKGLPALIEAWQRVTTPGGAWHLAVVGWDDGGHRNALEAQVREAGLEESVHFLGPMFNEKKNAAFRHADAFVLPSFSEGLPMAVLEAWSHGLPASLTPACNLDEGFEAEAAIRIQPDAASVADGLRRLFALSHDERAAMGRRGRALVEEQFTWPQVATQMHAIYEWVLEDGPRPGYVRRD